MAEEATGSKAAAKEPAKERTQIIWKGKAEEDAAPQKAKEAAQPAESEPLPEPPMRPSQSWARCGFSWRSVVLKPCIQALLFVSL